MKPITLRVEWREDKRFQSSKNCQQCGGSEKVHCGEIWSIVGPDCTASSKYLGEAHLCAPCREKLAKEES